MLDFFFSSWFNWSVLVLYCAFLLFIFLYSLSQLKLLLAYKKALKSSQQNIKLMPESYPMVTVQLPVYNERYVVERLIDAVMALKYPKNKLEVQVLDDSTDETSQIIQEKVGAYRSQGFDLVHIRRTKREGFKAGALAFGLDQAKGEFIAIFDADFLPPSNFLEETLPHFQDNRVGMVQSRWTHLNESQHLLTRLQAFGLDAHFTIEQGGRQASNAYINFNGTAGIWRKQCILDAGGWSSDTLTEDLDLSYRAQLKNWKFIYREDIHSPAELPVAMNALKSQQYRWTKGAAECTVKNLRKVFRKPDLDFYTRIQALFHLTNSFIFISVFMTALLSVLMLHVKTVLDFVPRLWFIGSLFLLSIGILGAFYFTSYQRIHNNGFIRFLPKFLAFLSMSMGLSLHNAIAVMEGYLGRKTPFVRTPKFNVSVVRNDWKHNIYLSRKLGWLPFAELLLSLGFAVAIYWGIELGDWGLVPFHAMLAVGFGLVGGTTLVHHFRIRQSH